MSTKPLRTPLLLAYPVDSDGVTLDTLNVRRPKAGDLLKASRQATDDEDREIVLFSWLAGVPRATIEDLDVADYRAFQRLYAGFTVPSSPRDGGTDGGPETDRGPDQP